MSGEGISLGWSIQGTSLLRSVIFVVHSIYFAIFGLRLLRLLLDHKVEIWEEKCSAGLAGFQALHWSAVSYSVGRKDLIWVLCALELFLEGHLDDWVLPDPLFCHGEPAQVYEGSVCAESGQLQ